MVEKVELYECCSAVGSQLWSDHTKVRNLAPHASPGNVEHARAMNF